MENKTGKRGRPKGTGKKDKIEKAISIEPVEGKKRGRKKREDIKVAPIEVALDGEVEGTTVEKLKVFSLQVQKMDDMLNHEPWNMAMRIKRTETVARMCYLIETL